MWLPARLQMQWAQTDIDIAPVALPADLVVAMEMGHRDDHLDGVVALGRDPAVDAIVEDERVPDERNGRLGDLPIVGTEESKLNVEPWQWMAKIDSPKEKKQERLAQEQGRAYEASYEILMTEDPHAVVEVDDYRITTSFEPAEGRAPTPSGSSRMAPIPGHTGSRCFEVSARQRNECAARCGGCLHSSCPMVRTYTNRRQRTVTELRVLASSQRGDAFIASRTTIGPQAGSSFCRQGRALGSSQTIGHQACQREWSPNQGRGSLSQMLVTECVDIRPNKRPHAHDHLECHDA